MDLCIDNKVYIKQIEEEIRVYAAQNYFMEMNVARMLDDLNVNYDVDEEKLENKISEIEKQDGIVLDEMQHKAVIEAVKKGLLIITGGPGTGKTTTIETIIHYFESEGMDLYLAAPTGRAAKRMTEATGYEAQTIHRLLELNGMPEEERDGHSAKFERNAQNPLEADVIIIDEMSMVDIHLMHSLLLAVTAGTRLILVGDENQLPSVGPGNVLRDIIRSRCFPVVELTKIFRQASESDIVVNAHKINKGEQVILDNKSRDFFFLQRPSGERLAATVAELCSERLPRGMGIPSGDIQVLTPTRKGESGTFALNERLQQVLNPPAPGKKEKIFGETVFREGDRVMQIRNNYDIVWCKGGDTAAIMDGEMAPGSAPETGTGIFNGDLGTILRIDTENELIWIDFDEKLAWYGFEQLGELDHAFAVTVHKAQGSEYRAVVLAAGRAPARLLSRDLLYTAVTRARELLVVVGETAIVQAMIENGRKTRRYSGLRARLAGEV